MEGLAVIVAALIFLVMALFTLQWSLKKVGLGKLLPGIGITIITSLGLVVFLVWKKLRKKP